MEVKTALTTAEVSARYSVHAETVRRMVKSGRLKAGNSEGNFRFSPEECDRVFLGIEPKGEEAA